jgi:hypothetical protein
MSNSQQQQRAGALVLPLSPLLDGLAVWYCYMITTTFGKKKKKASFIQNLRLLELAHGVR